MMNLYINACVRQESRTARLADKLLKQLGIYTELKLGDLDLKPLDSQRLQRRSQLLELGAYNHEMFALARQFASADKIVIAAPYWDGSFPAILKTYLENIYVTGIVSKYSDEGRPQGLCKARKLYFVTTAGGPYNPAFGYDYIKYLATQMFGINETELIVAEMLDIVGNDPEKILAEAECKYGLSDIAR